MTPSWLRALPIFLIAGVIAPHRALAVDHDFQQWTQLILQGELAGPLGGFLEVQPRWDEGASRLDRWILRPALFWRENDQRSYWLGYGGIEALHPSRAWEHRIWEQVQLTQQEEWGTLGQRFRLEQRFLPGVDPVGLRLRYLLRFVHPWASGSEWAWVTGDELFLNFNSPSASVRSGFDQNRLFLGVSWSFAPGLRAEAGYLNNFVRRPASAEDRFNHVALVSLQWTW
jgi:Protein of unknown function (DUF2490)